MAAIGIAIVVLVMIPAISLNPGDALAKNLPGEGPAVTGRDQLAAAGMSAGAISPINVTAEGATRRPGCQDRRRRRRFAGHRRRVGA